MLYLLDRRSRWEDREQSLAGSQTVFAIEACNFSKATRKVIVFSG
jgi:hypothetical protein